MSILEIFKELGPASAALVALLIVIIYLFKLIFKQIDALAEITKVISESNRIHEGTKSWIEGLLAAYKDRG